jgi:SAM-dependent methyltransferase
MEPYTKQYYEDIREGSRRSAREIIPIVLELVQPRHVIDVGCGLGTWLSVFKEFGIDDIWGIDGSWIDKTAIEIPTQRFLEADLTTPFRLERQFDLVVSLEVAEHLPSQSANTFIDSLVNLGPLVLFSAAIPFQGGTQHVNEQWPDYWVEHFQHRGYLAIDCIRKKIWENDNIAFYYAQNTLMFARNDYLEMNPILKREYQSTHFPILSLVHPRKYLEGIKWMQRWWEDVHLIHQHLVTLIPPADPFILVDQGQFGKLVAAGRPVIPFVECDGQYWGPPSDDTAAVQEFERLRRLGACFIVLAWPAFWWLDSYPRLHRHLRAKFPCVLQNERLIAFDLRHPYDFEGVQ